MVAVNFHTSDYKRLVTGADSLLLKNRYFEENPFLTEDGAALIARPGMRKLTTVGDGPIRGLHSEAGSFQGDLFVASGAGLYRMTNQLTSTLLYNSLLNPDKGFVNMAITARIGDVPEYCFIADGRNLFVYAENGFARNTITGTAVNTDTITVGSYVYKWTSGSVNAGSQNGSIGFPWLVSLGLTPLQAFTNMYEAINLAGDGSNYSLATIQNPDALAYQWATSSLSVQARSPGVFGNAIVTTETGGALSWINGGTLTGGGAPSITAVPLPDDVGAIDCAVIGSYVIVIPVQSNGLQGRFYWIEPGEVSIDPLNFATAESSPDGLFGVQVFGDQFWLPGESTTEVWYVTGDPSAPLQRLQGVVFDRGCWQNTALAVHETLVTVDPDGAVFTLQGGSPQRVSNPAIEEEIRKAISAQQGYIY